MTKLSLLAALALASVVPLTTGCAAESDFDDEEDVGIDSDEVRQGSSKVEGNLIDPNRIASLLRQNDVPESAVTKLVCAAYYESKWRDRSWNARNRNGTVDRGLFQVNSVHLKKPYGLCDDMSSEDLWDPAKNVKCAARIYREQGMNAWYGYRAHRTTKVDGGIRQLGCDVYRIGDTIETRR